MAKYRIVLTQEARTDLACFSAYERKIIVGTVKRQLSDQPTVETRNRKELRDRPAPRWELRIGKYRAFYEVDEPTSVVTVGAVGYKVHNVLYIRGNEVQL
ncbi:MAG: type II toxin-antitoxin system RelE/ParE family toxin [Candidatus Sumerlaeota bacterium]|nr:type II toxin-antitoxin system RelE/ParE family toxin [Candidatus Sumerlaeota bacterium]